MSHPNGGNAPALAAGQVLLIGKVRSARRTRGRQRGTETLITLPAADEFSHPRTVGVFRPGSGEPLGEVGAMVRVVAEVGGIPDSYEADGPTDPDTGEVRRVRVETARVSLRFVAMAGAVPAGQ